MVHRTQKNTLLSIVGLLQRLYITQWKSCIGQGMGKACGASMHSLGMPPSSIQLSEPYRSGGFHRGFITYKGGYTKKPELIYKKLCIYSYMFKLQSPSKYSPFDAIHLLRFFFHCSKQFLNSSILMPFSASAIFCFTYSTLTKHFPLRPFFNLEKIKGCLE